MNFKWKSSNVDEVILQNEDEVISYMKNEIDGGDKPDVVKFVKMIFETFNARIDKQKSLIDGLNKMILEKDDIITEYREIYEQSSSCQAKKKKRKGRSIFDDNESYGEDDEPMTENIFDEYDSMNDDFENGF